MNSNQPSANRRERIPLGTSHLSLAGKLTAQEVTTKLVNADNFGKPLSVTQDTDMLTPVTLNSRCGSITTAAPNSGSIAIGESQSFTFNNGFLSSDSILMLTVGEYTGVNATTPVVLFSSLADGSCTLEIHNTGEDTLDSNVVIHFMIFGSRPTQ